MIKFKRNLQCTPRKRPRAERRRGVAAVLSMMFLILFGSLAAAMAIVSKGNLRTATTHLHVMRAMGAAETGLAIAERRMWEGAGRFVVENSDINSDFGWKLWSGTFAAPDGVVNVAPPPSGHAEFGLPAGIAEALANYHAADQNTVAGYGAPAVGPAPVDTDPLEYRLTHWVTTPAVSLNDGALAGNGQTPTAFQITYAPLADGMTIRAFVMGIDFDRTRLDGAGSEIPLTRVLSKDFQLVKRVNQAVVSPSRIMIGKNVLVDGGLGAVYDDVNQVTGHPVLIRSDFVGLDAGLDLRLIDFTAQVQNYDVDGDNRLRVDHPTEGAGAVGFVDVTEDGYVDEFDLFLERFDSDGDRRITMSPPFTVGTPAEGMAPELVDGMGLPLDDDLELLLDSANPDRNKNGVYGFEDTNSNGMWDPGSEALNDFDVSQGVYRDHVLGYRDGFIDRKDMYAKVRGQIAFRVTEADWSGAQGNYQQYLNGPIIPDDGRSAVRFGAPLSVLPDLSIANFTNSQTALVAAADGNPFAEQVATQLGVAVSDLPTYVEGGADPNAPMYYRLDPDVDGDGYPDNYMSAYYEKAPFNAPNFADWYYRPVYVNMVFKDVVIPRGTNGLFVNCTFAGVTLVDSYTMNVHSNWTLYGRMAMDSISERPRMYPRREIYGDEPAEVFFPPMLPATALPPEALLLIADTPLDKADIPADQIPLIANYADIPDPLLIGGKRIIDTKAFSNNIRFHDCLFVGSIISTAPELYTHVRNKLQFTGATRFTDEHPDFPDDARYNPDPGDLDEIAKSSMMLPNYSVDIGSFNSPPQQDIRLRGAIIAGILDIRGNADIDGALLLTFRPVLGAPPLVDIFGLPVGNPALFNATLGYFGPEDGDDESLDPRTLPIVDGVPIVGWDLVPLDGLADLGPDDPPTQQQIDDGAVTVPFHGFGRINIRFDSELTLPDGIMLPMQVSAQNSSYQEGRRP